MKLQLVLDIQREEGDQYLTPVDRMGLAKSAISQLLFLLKGALRIDNWDLHLVMDSEAGRMGKIARGNEDWRGNDLAKAKRDAAKEELTGSKVKP